MLRGITSILLFLSFATIAAADEGEFSEGLFAWRAGDRERVLSIWRPLANAGEAEAQHALGLAYIEGKEVKANLGLLYAVGKGVAGIWRQRLFSSGERRRKAMERPCSTSAGSKNWVSATHRIGARAREHRGKAAAVGVEEATGRLKQLGR